MNRELRAAYRYHRALDLEAPRRARGCLMDARRDVAKGIKRYPRSGTATNPRMANGQQWIERPADIGLRFVGYADKVRPSIKHSGWYSDNDQRSLIRGVVYQLPGRDGKARYVAGHDNQDKRAADAGGPALIDWSQIHESDFVDEMNRALAGIGKTYQSAAMRKPGYWAQAAHETASREAAYAADQLAEGAAEEEREYNAAWQAGQRWNELGEQIEAERKDALALLAERRATRSGFTMANGKPWFPDSPAIRAKVAACMQAISEARQERTKLADGEFVAEWLPGFYRGDKRLREAFNEGAGTAAI